MQDGSCTGKFQYWTLPRARRGAKMANRKDNKSRLGPYKCKHCTYWHIGHSVKRTINRRVMNE